MLFSLKCKEIKTIRFSMYEVLRSARANRVPTNTKEYHVSIVGVSSLFGRLMVEYFARIVQKSLNWQVVVESAEEARKMDLELNLPSGYTTTYSLASSVPLLQQAVRASSVVVCCLDEYRKNLEIASFCAMEGCHFIGKLDQPKRVKNLHFLAKLNSCAIVTTCHRDITMSELGLLTLSATFSPGTLLEASLFRPLPNSYKELFWDTALLASEKIATSIAPTPSFRSNWNQQTSSPPDTEPTSPLEMPTPLVEPLTTPNDRTTANTYAIDRFKHIASLENLSSLDPKWGGLNATSSKLPSKAKSFGDLDELEINALEDSNSLPTVLLPLRSNSLRTIPNQRKLRPASVPATKAEPIFPTIKHVLHSRSLVSEIAKPTKQSDNPVVKQSLETLPTQLCSARRSLAPAALASTSLLPESNQGRHQLELHHLSTVGAGSHLFGLLLRTLLFIFLLFPLIRRWLVACAPYTEPFGGPVSTMSRKEEMAKIKFYADRSAATLPPAALRALNVQRTVSKPLSRDFINHNSQVIVVGGIGSTSEYIASSSTESKEMLKFVEVKAPGHLGPLHANVLCTSLCALALATSHSPLASRNCGVVPPLSAGGKILRDLLLAEGFTARNVSYGHK